MGQRNLKGSRPTVQKSERERAYPQSVRNRILRKPIRDPVQVVALVGADESRNPGIRRPLLWLRQASRWIGSQQHMQTKSNRGAVHQYLLEFLEDNDLLPSVGPPDTLTGSGISGLDPTDTAGRQFTIDSTDRTTASATWLYCRFWPDMR